MLKVGMGWLGWTEAETLSTTIPAIELAYQGRFELLKSIFGGKDAADTKFIPATGKNIRAALTMASGGKRKPKDGPPTRT